MKGFAALIAVVLLALPGWSQSSQTGLPPFGTFQNGKFDNINLQNLNVEFSIPLFSVPGRGLGLSGSISYNSGFWIVPIPCFGCYEQWGAWSGGTSPGWTTNNLIGTLSYQLTGYTCSRDNTDTTEYSNFQVTEPNGTVHVFTVDYFTPKTNCPDYQTDVETSVATDSSGWYVDGKNFKAYSPSGVAINCSVGCFSTDPNGNYVKATVFGEFGPENYADTVNRTITFSASNTVQSYTLKDSNGNAQTFTLNLQQFTIQTNFGCSGVLEAGPYSQYLPVSLVLPNGQSYTFHYEPTPGYPNSTTGRISEVDLPTGGKYQYSYGPIDCTYGAPTSLTRTITNGTAVATWQYSRSETDVNNVLTTTVTITAPEMPYDSAANQRVVTFVTGQPTKTDKYYQGTAAAGTLLGTIQTVFQPQYVNDQLATATPATTTITLGNNQVSQTATTYDNQGRLLERDDYDWGNGSPGALLRKVTNTYLNSFTYIALGLSNRLASTVIQNGSGTTVAQAQYEYDNYTQGISPSGAVQHNSSFGTSYTTRGNLTAVERWRNTDSTWLTTRFQYDDAGNVLSSTDPNSHTTSTSWSDSWANSTCAPSGGNAAAYPTTVTNALGQAETTKYNSCTGTVASTTDANNQPTTYAYDEMGRTTQITYPDTGQTSYAYNDVTPPSMTVTSKINSTQNLTTTTLFDDLGQESQTQLSDPEGTDYTDTSYDAIGRIYTVSNPYRSTSDPTYGITTYEYDALGRATQVTNPDNSIASTSYTGRATEVTDESGKQRISQADGLGRLTSVCEVTSTTLSVGISGSKTPAPCGLDIGATGFLTTYGYDTLGDLTSVTQGPLNPRSFSYNSLGELLTANNPESGQTSYTYDADGNLATKTDARGTSITYSYDALNRLTGKTYSDSTPAVTYNYDQSSAYSVSLTNTVGRLSSESTAGTYPTHSVFSYDPLGRITNNTQSLWGGYTQSLPYTYDFLGDRLTSNVGAPNGTLAVTETYNAVGRLTQTTTNPAYYNSGISTLITSAHYNALGERTQQALGNGLTENWTYDNRGRETSYSLTNGSTSLYSYSLSYFPNGNVLTSNDSINGDWVFGYDDLNRMTSATVTGQEHSPNATFAYLYDRFSNRWDQNVTSGSGPTSSLAFDANNHITTSGVTYDAAGNVTYDGTNTYTYDAEGRISGDPSLNTQELYDAEGRRDIIISPSLQYPDYYVYDLQNHPLGIWNPAYAYFRGEYYASGHHLATFSNLLMFNHPDWLGTEHYRTEPSGAQYGSCQNDPFGDNMWCSEAQGDLSPVHFTGKERDYSGTANPDNLDYFGARFYSSSMGRFMTPDPSGISLADLNDPQQLNLYSYVRNNPADMTDPTGLDPGFCGIEGDEYPCGFGENCWDYDILSCWHDFQQAPQLAPLSPFAANPASSFIATGPGTDWQTILFGPPNPSLLIINNFGGFPPLVDPASIFGSICPAGGGTIGEAASNCTPSLSFLPFYGYKWPYPHDDLPNLMRREKRSTSQNVERYFTKYLPCWLEQWGANTIGDNEHAEAFGMANIAPRVGALFGPIGLGVGTGVASIYDFQIDVSIESTCTAQTYGQ